MSKLLISLLIILLPSVSFAKPMWYNATSHIGGTTSSLDSVDGQNLFDGDNAIVFKASGQTDLYQLDADSGLTEDSVYYRVISPDSNAGNKRWLKVGTSGRILVPDSTVDQGDSAVVGTLAWHIDNASSNDVTVTVLEGTHLITTNTTIPATMTLKVLRGGVLSLTGTLTINGTIEAGSYRIFDGTLSNLTLTALQEINATWGGGVPDGATDQTTDLDGLIAACVPGSEIVFPTFASSWKFNVSIAVANITLKGMGIHYTPVIPNADASPVFDLEAQRITIKNFDINGNGAGTTVYGIRVDRDATAPASRFVIEDNHIRNVTNGIYVKNNYYGRIQNNKIEDITYGVLGRNAFNDNILIGNKYDDADYGVAILHVLGTDTNNSHSNLLEKETFESMNAGAIGIWLYNVSDNNIVSPYFETCDWPVIDAGSAVLGWDKGAGGQNVYLDGYERNLVNFGVEVGMTVYNRTEGTSDTIASIGDGNSTNDQLTMSTPGTITFDNEDYIVIDVDATDASVSRNSFSKPHFTNNAHSEAFLVGLGPSSTIVGNWSRKQDGKNRVNHTSAQAVASSTEYTLDFSGNFSGWTGRPLGMVLISYSLIVTGNADGSYSFLPIGGDQDDDAYFVGHFLGNTKTTWDEELSGIIALPMSMLSSTSKYKVGFLSSAAVTLSVRMHGFWQ